MPPKLQKNSVSRENDIDDGSLHLIGCMDASVATEENPRRLSDSTISLWVLLSYTGSRTIRSFETCIIAKSVWCRYAGARLQYGMRVNIRISGVLEEQNDDVYIENYIIFPIINDQYAIKASFD